MALDQGYRIVIVLSGGKDDLRWQTARRFNTQLLRYREQIPKSGGAWTLSTKETEGALSAFCLPYFQDAHQSPSFHLGLMRALEQGRPAVIIIKKHGVSLGETRRKLELAYQREGLDSLPTLVIDDECDDASIDTAGMPIPTAIAGLWRRPQGAPPVAYVGYTATSAANLLQHRDNDLFPAEFACLNRYPAEKDAALSFAEPVSDAWYTGGAAFYEEFGDEPGPDDNFLVSPSVEDAHLQAPPELNPSLVDAVRAFIIGGAYRLALNPDWSLKDCTKYPKPHSMLVQTSASQGDHRLLLEGMGRMFEGATEKDSAAFRWKAESIVKAVTGDETAWKRWYDEFSISRARILAERPRIGGGRMVSWAHVKEAIAPFIENLRIKVVNSDEELGATLDFAKRVSGDGRALPPQDIFTIVIGGAKLSRGLTVEGLATTYFTRWNPSPTEDTVLQLSRWFGYRGPFLEFCRLFTTPDISRALFEMQCNDTDLREQLATLMAERRSPADAALVIQMNPKALPTAKLGEGRRYSLSFSPLDTVFNNIEGSDVLLQAANEKRAVDLVERVRARQPREVRAASGAQRGILSLGWEAEEVADLLDGFSYAKHNPSAFANPAKDFYRKPDAFRPVNCSRALTRDPYQIAAYLRQWKREGERCPLFNVGIAYGAMDSDTAPFNYPLVNREITSHDEVVGGWTGRRDGWAGDRVFDEIDPSLLAPGTTRRLMGAPGLLVMYVVHRAALGLMLRGKPRSSHTPFIGLIIPEGGPRWDRVAVDRRKVVTV